MVNNYNRQKDGCVGLVQAVTQLVGFMAEMYARLPPAQLVSPTVEFLQGVGSASSNPLIRFVLARNLFW